MRNAQRKIREIIWAILLIPIVSWRSAAAQCSVLTGFPRQVCEAALRAAAAHHSSAISSSIPVPAGQMLTTGLPDAIRGQALGPVLSPKQFKSLFKLDRNDDGTFILKPGFYEAYVESYYFDNPNPGLASTGAFFPAPYLGPRASILSAVFKQAEIHPELTQAAIQELVLAIYAGTDIERMQARTQQTAVVLLPKAVAKQLQAATEDKDREHDIMVVLNKRDGGANQGQQDPAPRQSTAPQSFSLDDDSDAASSLPVARGSWAQMPGGFYVRYLPEGFSRVRVQVMVSDAAVAKAGTSAPLTFDPTQYVAILAQPPALRLGISLRPVRH